MSLFAWFDFIEFAQNELQMRPINISRIFGRSCDPNRLQRDVAGILKRLSVHSDFPGISQVTTFNVWESISGDNAMSHIRVIIQPQSFASKFYHYSNYNFRNFSLELMVYPDTNEPTLISFAK